MNLTTKVAVIAGASAFALGFGGIAIAQASGLGEAWFLDKTGDTDLYFIPVQERLDLGHEICNTYDAGVSTQRIVNVMLESGYDGYETGTIVSAAVYSFCDEYAPDLQAWAEAE